MKRSRSWASLVLGIVIAFIGAILAVGGLWLAVLGGSLYYFAAGAAMIASGVLLFRGRLLGAWVYIGLFVFTLVWAFWEVGGDAWALVPRIVAPLVLLIATILVIPTLVRGKNRWRFAGAGALASVALVAILFTVLGTRSREIGTLPAPSSNAMADPSGQATGADWPAYGGTGAARRYSALAQINPANVGELERAWVFHTRDLPSARAKGT